MNWYPQINYLHLLRGFLATKGEGIALNGQNLVSKPFAYDSQAGKNH